MKRIRYFVVHFLCKLELKMWMFVLTCWLTGGSLLVCIMGAYTRRRRWGEGEAPAWSDSELAERAIVIYLKILVYFSFKLKSIILIRTFYASNFRENNVIKWMQSNVDSPKLLRLLLPLLLAAADMWLCLYVLPWVHVFTVTTSIIFSSHLSDEPVELDDDFEDSRSSLLLDGERDEGLFRRVREPLFTRPPLLYRVSRTMLGGSGLRSGRAESGEEASEIYVKH